MGVGGCVAGLIASSLITADDSDTTTADQAQDDRNHGDDKQQMNQPSQCVGGEHAKKPKNDQKNRNCFKHSSKFAMVTNVRV